MTEYRELEKKFIQAQKMESIGKLAGGVAHDFNNFLTGIIGSAEMLKLTANSNDNPDNNEYLDTILTAGNKASSLVKQLLNFSRLESGPTEIINIETIIDDTTALLKRSIKQQILLEKQISDSDIFIRGENAQIVNALLNLGINARDSIENNGKITISARKVHLKPSDFPEDEISYGFYARIDVNDTGSGIPKHLIDKIFDPFFTTKEQGKGTGLGLSSVYGTIKRHKGIIKVYSEPGIGTTFSLFIPLTEVDPKHPKKIMNSIIKNMNPCNILLVDDEEVIRKNTAKLLRDFSHSVITAENGLDALGIIRNTDNKFDIVILDWIMPKMNGDETLRIIRSLYPDLKVLVSSGFGTDKKLLESAAAYSKVFFLAKPYTPEEILEVISEMQNTP
jgi:nitrogen-specific signal transduction histidine kinase/CheY-like chemotaxis protein